MVAQDEMEKFSWVRHDGLGYGRQQLNDRDGKVDILTSFAVNTDATSQLHDGWSWVQRFDVRPRQVPASETLFMFYFGADCDGVFEEDVCMSMAGLVDMRVVERPVAQLQTSAGMSPVRSVAVIGKHSIGQTNSSGFFFLELNLYAEDNAMDGI